MDNGAWPVTPGLGRKPEDQEFDSSSCTVSWRPTWVVPDPVSENKQTKKYINKAKAFVYEQITLKIFPY